MSDRALTGVIVAMASLLGLFLRRIRQPKVIAEVLGGILLGTCHRKY
jgi:Kef-type K+ transport system membrane component KefB